MIRFTTLGVVPSIVPVESGVPDATRRIFEVVTSGDATFDIVDPTTGRVMMSRSSTLTLKADAEWLSLKFAFSK